jgi:DNA-binding GntR family transcriptional regulator
VDHEGKSAKAYRLIEHMIIWQELTPGSLVSEKLLMDLTGLGRTPVREAVQRLSRERMVSVHPNRGVLVPGASVEAQLKRLELRRPLDSLAVSLACRRATGEQRCAMGSLAARLQRNALTLKEYAETVRETHNLIVASAHNEYLADAMAPLQGLSRRFWICHVRDAQREIRAGGQLHYAILTAIRERDEERAQAYSLELNDYLTDFALSTLREGVEDRGRQESSSPAVSPDLSLRRR